MGKASRRKRDRRKGTLVKAIEAPPQLRGLPFPGRILNMLRRAAAIRRSF